MRSDYRSVASKHQAFPAGIAPCFDSIRRFFSTQSAGRGSHCAQRTCLDSFRRATKTHNRGISGALRCHHHRAVAWQSPGLCRPNIASTPADDWLTERGFRPPLEHSNLSPALMGSAARSGISSEPARAWRCTHWQASQPGSSMAQNLMSVPGVAELAAAAAVTAAACAAAAICA
jgi:hypothetical protein